MLLQQELFLLSHLSSPLKREGAKERASNAGGASLYSQTEAARNSQVRGQFGLQSVFSQLGHKDPVLLQKKKGKKK